MKIAIRKKRTIEEETMILTVKVKGKTHDLITVNSLNVFGVGIFFVFLWCYPAIVGFVIGLGMILYASMRLYNAHLDKMEAKIK